MIRHPDPVPVATAAASGSGRLGRRLVRVGARRPAGRHRQHGSVQEHDRRELEESGWRTTLDYRENHVRTRDGRLVQLQIVWRAEAEHAVDDGSTIVVAATASTVPKVWSRLRHAADLAVLEHRRTVRPAV